MRGTAIGRGKRLRLRLGQQLLVLIVVPLGVLLLFVAAVTYQTLETRGAGAAARASNQGLASVQALLVTLIDAETGMRGYVLTGDRAFTEPYLEASRIFRLRIAELEIAALADPSSRDDIVEVVSRARAAFAKIDATVHLIDRGQGVRAQIDVAAGYGKRTMDDFRSAVVSYQAAEQSRENAYRATVAHRWAIMYALLVAGALGALATTILLYFTISRSIIVRLQGLKRDANAVAAGGIPPAVVAGARSDEITQVEQSFHDMAELLSEREKALVRGHALQRAILATTDRAVVTAGTDGIVTSFNGGAERLIGYASKDVIGSHKLDDFYLTLEPDAPQQHVEGRERTIVRSDGAHVPVTSTRSPLLDESGTVFGFLDVSADITQRKLAEEAIVRSEVEQREYASQLRSLHLIANTVATAEKDPVDRSLRLGLEELGLDCAYVGVVDEDRCELVIENSVRAPGTRAKTPLPAGAHVPLNRAFIGSASNESEVYAVEDLRALHDGSPPEHAYGDARAYIAAPIYVSGSLFGALGFLGDDERSIRFSEANRDFVRVTADLVGAAIERARQRARLDVLAFFDGLTGLPNRVLLLDRLTQRVLTAERYDERFALLYLDLDGFKAVNDAFGHGVGDKVLVETARRFERLARRSDTVARLGGDEFVILAPKVATEFDAGDVAERILQSMRTPIVVDGVGHLLTVSIGIGTYPHDGRDAQTLLAGADRALYAAKARGANTYVFASDSALISGVPAQSSQQIA